uniref:Uncharacterized protein n=1 Tax=Rhizophora mucronata TaxID=61149 RepID=A0A2P2N7M7_RHIMU
MGWYLEACERPLPFLTPPAFFF